MLKLIVHLICVAGRRTGPRTPVPADSAVRRATRL